MKILIVTSSVALVILLIWIIGSLYAISSLEEPKYNVIQKYNGFEIRQYSDYIVAEVEVEGTQDQTLNNGFRQLAGYIFGGNKGNNSIAMTAPVSESKSESTQISMTVPVSETINGKNNRIVQFSMPSEYTLETLPILNNENVKLKTIEGYKAAVLQYTGYAGEKKVEKMKLQLSDLLKQSNIEINGEMVSAQYNPPFSFPFVRRNEIIVQIK